VIALEAAIALDCHVCDVEFLNHPETFVPYQTTALKGDDG